MRGQLQRQLGWEAKWRLGWLCPRIYFQGPKHCRHLPSLWGWQGGARPLALVGTAGADSDQAGRKQTGIIWQALWCSINCDNNFSPRCDTTAWGWGCSVGCGAASMSSYK